MIPIPEDMPLILNTKTIFLNRCKGGCVVKDGSTDSRTNTSDIGAGTLSEFSEGDTTWKSVVDCMKQTFSRFDVTITDVDPGPYVDHFEILVAGQPGQVGLPGGVGGIADVGCTNIGQCATFLPNALVFVFDVWGSDVNEICSTAAQEIAHTWALDHVTDASDPMTYNSYNGMRTFKDGVRCGSDCSNGTSPFGLPCNTAGEHVCMINGTYVQDDVQTLLKVFGPTGTANPTLTIKNPAGTFSGQTPGFSIDVECTSADPIQEVILEIDGKQIGSVTAAPYHFTAPAMLVDGLHHLNVVCGTTKLGVSTKQTTVLVGAPCVQDVCAAGFVCYDSICIAGPDTPGGAGAPCASDADCMNNAVCASDGKQNECALSCDLNDPVCPSGFGCLDAGATAVCWPGVDNGGCCDTSGGGTAPGALLLGLGLGATLITRRRKR